MHGWWLWRSASAPLSIAENNWRGATVASRRRSGHCDAFVSTGLILPGFTEFYPVALGFDRNPNQVVIQRNSA